MRRSTLAASLLSTRTVDFGTWVTRASSTGTPALRSASRTWSISAGAVVISKTFSARRMSVAPASRALASRSSSLIFSASTWITPLRSNIHATAPAEPRLPPCFSKTWRISGPVRLRLSVRTWIRRATPPGAYPSYVTSSYDSPGTSPVPFWTARLMLSAGMFASLADSIAPFRRMFAFASPPPFFAATVISRRILLNSLPRCTSALSFLRLICDHRECPDITCSPLGLDRRLQPLHPLEAPLPPHQRRLPAPPLARGAGRERAAGARTEVRPEMHEREIRGARVPHLARPRLLGEDLHPDLERRGADVVEPRLERHHLVGADRRIEIHRIEARRHHEPLAVAHGQDAAGLVELHEHLTGEHHAVEERVLRKDRAHRLEPPLELVVGGGFDVGDALRLLGEARQAREATAARGLDQVALGRVARLHPRGDRPGPRIL